MREGREKWKRQGEGGGPKKGSREGDRKGKEGGREGESWSCCTSHPNTCIHHMEPKFH